MAGGGFTSTAGGVFTSTVSPPPPNPPNTQNRTTMMRRAPTMTPMIALFPEFTTRLLESSDRCAQSALNETHG
jgi:hypothetical protein